jgi:ERCC4-type nuclease
MNKTKILSDITIISDSRERKNDHILTWFKDNNISYKVEKLDSGDYSLILPNYPELDLDRKFLIERKANLDELSNNLTKDRDRFHREFERLGEFDKMHLVIENATFKKMLSGSYRSSFSPKAYLASLLTFAIRYDINVWFTTPAETGQIIYSILYYELYEYLNYLESLEK